MTSDSPDPLNQSNAAVLMSQPLASSPASILSRRKTVWDPGPPLWNSTRMLRPIDDDGTSRYSIGALGLEYAAAVGARPAAKTTDNAAARGAASSRRQNQEARL